MTIKLSKKIRKSILDGLIQEKTFIEFFNGGEEIVRLLAEIFPLEKMPSEDARLKTASEDLSRHLILNYDWTAEYLLKDRLKFLEIKDEDFIKFIELLISPDYQIDVDAIHSLVTFFNSYLKSESYKLILSGYKNKLPIYKLVINSGAIKNIPADVEKNNINFISRGVVYFSEKPERHSKPDLFPSFILAKDTWDDYHAKTYYNLFYYPDSDNPIRIGALRIMKKGELETKLPTEFFLLNEKYCSLGVGEEFYKKLSDVIGDDFFSVLFALRDAAFFPLIHEEFEDEEVFKNSLVRGDNEERGLRTISYKFSGGDLESRYRFEYDFKPLFAESTTKINFPFCSTNDVTRRIIAVIGKNGTGKTQLLTSLAKDLSDKNSVSFKPRTPAFGKILAVSYSVFDDFEIPKRDVSFNYKYCGLKKPSGELLTKVELEKRFYESADKISKKNRITKLKKVLLNFIDEDVVGLIIQHDRENVKELLKISFENYSEIKNKLSSGQTVLLYIVVEILAELRYDSLILFDEPETHLHPNAITQLVSAVYDLVEQFDSFCIIATHSPLIIQSIKSDSVYITEKEENVFSVRKIGSESFGENLSNITDEIFGNRDVCQEYKKIIQKLLSRGDNYEEIIKTLESDDVPLSFNVRVYIKNLIKTE